MLENADMLWLAAIPLNGALTVVNVGPALQLATPLTFQRRAQCTFHGDKPADASQPNHAWDYFTACKQASSVTTNSLALLPLEIKGHSSDCNECGAEVEFLSGAALFGGIFHEPLQLEPGGS